MTETAICEICSNQKDRRMLEDMIVEKLARIVTVLKVLKHITGSKESGKGTDVSTFIET